MVVIGDECLFPLPSFYFWASILSYLFFFFFFRKSIPKYPLSKVQDVTLESGGVFSFQCCQCRFLSKLLSTWNSMRLMGNLICIYMICIRPFCLQKCVLSSVRNSTNFLLKYKVLKIVASLEFISFFFLLFCFFFSFSFQGTEMSLI